MFVRTGLVIGLLVVGSGLAMADNNSDKVAATGAMSTAQVTTRLQSQGFTVSKIKLDDGRYKVKAIDSTGHKSKLYVNPQTGDVVSKGVDDDDD